MIKTFRGLIADGGIDTIVLHTNDGSMGYRIVKFQIIPEKPGAQNYECVVTISKVSFTPSTTIDLSNNTLVGVAYWHSSAAVGSSQEDDVIIFDNEIFNQDIYIGSNDIQGESMNYYLELEQVKLDKNENTVATLKDIRNRKTQGF